MRHRALPFVLVLWLAAFSAACASAPETAPDPPDSEPDAATVDREAIAASLDEDEARDLAARVNAFGFDLLAELVGQGDDANVVTSPVSVATLLAMILAGAGGETAEDMAAALHLDDAEVGSEHAALLFALSGSADVTLAVANSLWIDGPMETDYLSLVREVFDATAAEVDLGAQETADRLDEWVTDSTAGMIDTIAADLGLPDPAAVLVLLNAVYFQGTWTVEFDPEETADGPFTTGAGDEVTVALMRHPTDIEERFAYADVDGTQMLRLPYGTSERFAMDLVLPPPGGDLDDVVADLDASAWAALTERLTEEKVAVTLPRLELEYDANLVEALGRLGMEAAFSPGADFRPMSPLDPFLDTVAHKTAIRVDESGTEAAAVTGGVMAVSAPPEFRADRPFLFAVTDTRTGAALFLGTVTDPTA